MGETVVVHKWNKSLIYKLEIRISNTVADFIAKEYSKTWIYVMRTLSFMVF